MNKPRLHFLYSYQEQKTAHPFLHDISNTVFVDNGTILCNDGGDNTFPDMFLKQEHHLAFLLSEELIKSTSQNLECLLPMVKQFTNQVS